MTSRPPQDARPQWVTPPPPPVKRPASKTSRRDTARSCAGLTVALAVGVGFLVYFFMPSHDTPTMKAAADNGQTLPEQLTFKGVINAKLATALNAQGVKHAQADPQPNSGGAMFLQTSCSDYKLGQDDAPFNGDHEWSADIYGRIGGKAITLRFGLEDTTAIAGKHDLDSRGGTSFPNVVQPYLDQAGRADSLYYPIYGSTITINPDMHSGTVHFVASDTPMGDAKETVDGTWRCA